MNLMKPIAFILLAALSLTSCQRELKYHYAIRDFRQALQPALEEIVSKGIDGYGDINYETIKRYMTESELKKMTNCEHPVLRLLALEELFYRPDIDKFDLLIHHLDDTAIVQVDNGEFGTDYRMVSDRLIDDAQRQNKECYEKVIDTVIKKYNYLSSAYSMLEKFNAVPKYYPYIKAMVMRKKPYSELENAVAAIEKYKKKEDAELIKSILLDRSNISGMTCVSLNLMKDYLDTSYMLALERCGRHYFHSKSNRISGVIEAACYINILGSCKNLRSAEMLNYIWNSKLIENEDVHTSFLKGVIINSIETNNCSAYANFRKKIDTQIIEYKKSLATFPLKDRLFGSIK